MRKIKTPRDVHATKMRRAGEIKLRPTTYGDVKGMRIPPPTARCTPGVDIIRGKKDINHIDKQPWEERSAEAMRIIGRQRFYLANRLYLAMKHINKLLAESRLTNEELRETSEELEAGNEELRTANEELERRTVVLESLQKELEAFTYSVSHDLRAPLRSIDGFSQAVLEDYADKLDEQGKNYLRKLRSASQHMAQLIDDMLELSRITRVQLQQEKVNLSAAVQAIAAELRERQPERRVEFIIAEGVVVDGDAKMLRMMLDKLLDNAWKFTGRHPSARIEFGVTEQEGKPVYFVRDDGAGFDMAHADKLFGAFQRLHTTTEFEGIGIGLSLAQRIILKHDGRIWAEGEVEKGATFYFTL
ncbi:MAG TPA: sensor histidine kinase [Candidatus Avalokitesvara rifleensis]|uniref:sensor histidine kinase n=1 Tax=Candidatus Avalokitesvara rifleensis TaxID=3367620 RepID=UPI0040287CDD